jgi:hypothetical protein
LRVAGSISAARFLLWVCGIPDVSAVCLEVLMQQQRFRIEDRIRTLQPVGWVTRGSYGTIVRVFFGFDTYGVCFDGAGSIRVVPGHMLERLSD